MISRVAEHCFWLHRYVERAENTARLLQVNRSFVLDAGLAEHDRWHPILVVAGEHHRFPELVGDDFRDVARLRGAGRRRCDDGSPGSPRPWAVPYLFTLATSVPGLPGGGVVTGPTPWSASAPAGVPVPIEFALQGVLVDGPNRVAATNAVLVRVR